MRAMLLALAVAAVVFGGGADARVIERDFHRAFDVGEGARLRLYHGDGDVVITPWEKDVIDVSVRYYADVTAVGFGADADFDVEFRQDGDVVTVRGIEGSSAGVFILRSTRQYEYTYTISAPSYTVLQLRGDDGDVELSGWRADIACSLDDGDVSMSDVVNSSTEIRLEDGDVRLSGLSCELTVRGDDGDVTLRDCRVTQAILEVEDGDITITDSEGSFEAETDDGDVDIRRVAASIVDVRVEDANVDLDLEGRGEIHVNIATEDGDVTARLSPGLSFDYLVTMDDGDVNVELDGASGAESAEHRVSGRVGAGGGLVRVRTADGDVSLTTAR